MNAIVNISPVKTSVKLEGVVVVRTDSTQYAITSTPRIEIINNKILLPSKPVGGLIFNMMMVFELDENDSLVRDFLGVRVSTDAGGNWYADLDMLEEINGFGMVSYLAKTSI